MKGDRYQSSDQEGFEPGSDEKVLSIYTPGLKFNSIDELAHALSIVHVEFILIHPFREGNGRLGRLLCSLIALQAGRNMMNMSWIATNEGRKAYIRAVQAGVSENYMPMENIFMKMLTDL